MGIPIRAPRTVGTVPLLLLFLATVPCYNYCEVQNGLVIESGSLLYSDVFTCDTTLQHQLNHAKFAISSLMMDETVISLKTILCSDRGFKWERTSIEKRPNRRGDAF